MTWPGSDLTTCWIASALAAVRQGDVADAGLLARRGQRQHRADDVENAVALADRFDRNAGEHALVRAGDDDVAAGGDAPGRNEARQQALQAVDVGSAILADRGDAVEALGEQIGDRREVAFER